ncbi:MAG: hypothetical protein IJK89_06615 [Clostridia bacterium]|nr:hypothetical protein [Clostridia bacterium]
MTDVILVCEDVFGLEILDLLRRINAYLARNDAGSRYRILGYVSDAPAPFGGMPAPAERLGDLASHPMRRDARYVLGIKDPASKRAAVAMILSRGGRFETVCSPWMICRPMTFGEGAVMDAYSVTISVSVGDYVTVCDSMLAVEGSIGAYSTVMRFANVICDGVGEEAFIGSCAFVPHGVTVGDRARVLDGSIVVKNVKPGTTVSGNPARKIS